MAQALPVTFSEALNVSQSLAMLPSDGDRAKRFLRAAQY